MSQALSNIGSLSFLAPHLAYQYDFWKCQKTVKCPIPLSYVVGTSVASVISHLTARQISLCRGQKHLKVKP